jgi:hypothetical protein
VLVETEGGVRHTFVKNAERTVRLVEVDISGVSGQS